MLRFIISHAIQCTIFCVIVKILSWVFGFGFSAGTVIGIYAIIMILAYISKGFSDIMSE